MSYRMIGRLMLDQLSKALQWRVSDREVRV
jgi:hypothetical protein